MIFVILKAERECSRPAETGESQAIDSADQASATKLRCAIKAPELIEDARRCPGHLSFWGFISPSLKTTESGKNPSSYDEQRFRLSQYPLLKCSDQIAARLPTWSAGDGV
ncbi:MAG: hypothetical protein WBM04_12610 [Candidatus Korobacteraceae bacterium]